MNIRYLVLLCFTIIIALTAAPAALAQAPCTPDFYGVELGDFPACHDYWTKNNLSLVTLSQYQIDDVTYLAGSFQSGPKRRAKWGQTQASLEKLNAQYLAEGWRLDQVNVMSVSNGQWYAGIWIQDQLTWENHNKMSQTIFDQRFTDMDKGSWNLLDLASFRVKALADGQHILAVRWSGVWAGAGAGNSAVHDNMTMKDFLAKDGGLLQDGYKITRFITYRGDSRKGSPLLHAAIWRRLGANIRMLPDMHSADFHKANKTNVAAGYRLYYINAFGDLISAIWIKDPPPIKKKV